MSDQDAITRLNAALEGRYRIEREIGEGGMATVYLADDMRHERKVALKVLRPELAAVVGAERFLAEIKTTAQLQHPHILPLFDSGEADGFLFYVMPYVEGETLRDRIEREKQLPVDEALGIATAVANALQTAHEQGIIHRDIKPGNILLSRGEPLVADFGIALAVGASGGARLTETGLSVGTPYYMSPEQATGDQNVGPAADTYALACVLYEMLVGEPPYLGNTAQAVLGKIIQGLPVSAMAARRAVPPNVDAAIRKALEKLPADRFMRAHDFARALADPAFRYGEGVLAGGAGPRGQWNRLSVGTTVVAVIASVIAGWSLLRPAARARVARFPSPFLEGQAPIGPMLLTPDGSALIYTGLGPTGVGSQLWIRRWDALAATPIPGTEGARTASSLGQLVLSPDGREIAFTLGNPGPLRVVPIEGGPSRTLVESASGIGGWSDDGWVYFQSGGQSIQRIPVTGSEADAEVLTERTAGETYHTLPHLLPGGRALVFQVLRGPGGSESEIWSLDVETHERTMLVPGNNPRYVPTGHLLFGTPDGRLMAAPFDVDGAKITGFATPVAEGLANAAQLGNIQYSVSEDGTLIYLEGEGGGGLENEELIVVDLDGNPESLAVPPAPFGRPSWSPDGRFIVYSRFDEATDAADQIFTFDVAGGSEPRQLTFEGVNTRPLFSHDGSHVVFSSLRDGTESEDLWTKALGDDSPATPLISLPGSESPSQWPSDTLILFSQNPAPSGLWILDLSGPDSPSTRLYLPPDGDLDQMKLSRDGTLAAYHSDRTGTDEVYIRSFPEPGEPTKVSQGGGQFPLWSPDGAILYYWSLGGPQGSAFIAARIQRDPTVVLRTDTLFTGPYAPAESDLHPDGDRVLVTRALGGGAEETASTRYVLVQNFFEELRARVPN